MEGVRLDLVAPIGDAISRVRFAPASNNLLISSWDSCLRLYDVDGSVPRSASMAEGAAALLDCCFEGADTAALTAGSDGCVRRYNMPTGTQTIVGKHDNCVTCIEYSEATCQIITAGLDKRLSFWDSRTINGNAGPKKVVDSEVWSMSLCGGYLVVAVGALVDVYDLRNLNSPTESRETFIDHQIKCISSISNRQGFAVGSIDGHVSLKYLDPLREKEMGYVFRCHPKLKDAKSHLVAVNDLAFHPHSSIFISGDNNGSCIIWDFLSQKKVYEFPRRGCSIASLSFNYNGQLLALASSHTYQEANEVEEAPQVFVHDMDSLVIPKCSEQMLLP